MGWLPTSIFPSEARFAHVAFSFRLVEIYVPFVCRTSARRALRLARVVDHTEPATHPASEQVRRGHGQAMRKFLVDSARRKRRIKHGGGRHRVELDDDVPEP